MTDIIKDFIKISRASEQRKIILTAWLYLKPLLGSCFSRNFSYFHCFLIFFLDGFGERRMLKKRSSFSVLWYHNGSNNYNNYNNDNNKDAILKFLASSPLKVICRHCNTTYPGMFPKLIFSHFFFLFRTKVQLITAVIFQFFR